MACSPLLMEPLTDRNSSLSQAERPQVVNRLIAHFAMRQTCGNFAMGLARSAARRGLPFQNVGHVTLNEIDSAWKAVSTTSLKPNSAPSAAIPRLRCGVWQTHFGIYSLEELPDGRLRYVESVPDGRLLLGTLSMSKVSGWWEAVVRVAADSSSLSDQKELMGHLRLRSADKVDLQARHGHSFQSISKVLAAGELDWECKESLVATLIDGEAPRYWLGADVACDNYFKDYLANGD
eukprot:TRINITY_DN35580_c0_g1_i1.p1 TRINITY_DN35580_c0_g1~~TRINITY_DN35580_c0_g1_i1.p1  ORF type:complete len:263 (+),score=44.85 TRINITY_DN35580_c0_g1_i1:85-789(+)